MTAGTGYIIKLDSGYKCDNCGNNFSIVKGWESDRAYKCLNCSQYYYWVGMVCCGNTLVKDQIIPPKLGAPN